LKRFERQTQVKAHLRLLGNGLPLSSDQKLQAIFILQEALSNVRKHAHAETVLVTVRNEADFSMTIMDDGVGIDERLMQERQQRHVGLSIMQERAQKVSGSIEIESESQVGTTVRFKLPKEVRQAL
jgi:two-component system nitrate/nitrite sensor histidine kinase NarX